MTLNNRGNEEIQSIPLLNGFEIDYDMKKFGERSLNSSRVTCLILIVQQKIVFFKKIQLLGESCFVNVNVKPSSS